MLHLIGRVSKLVQATGENRYENRPISDKRGSSSKVQLISSERGPSTFLRVEKGKPGVVLKCNRSKKAGSELTGTGVHPIQAWKDAIGVHDFLATLQKKVVLKSLSKETYNKNILHSIDISTQRGIEAGGMIKALAIGIAVWGEISLDPIIPTATILFDPSFLLADMAGVDVSEFYRIKMASSYESLSSCYESCKESLSICYESCKESLSSSSSNESCKDIGSQLFDPLTILQQEKTEEERTVMEEIRKALEENRYSHAMKIFAGALVLTLVLCSISKK